LEKTGLVSRVYEAVEFIDIGRKGWAARGKAEEGRISYEGGIAKAMAAFQEAQVSADPQTIILVEYAFLSQELHFYGETDEYTFGSLTQAIQSFDDAFLALEAVDEPGYKTADKTYPTSGKYRVSGFPKDAFHIACIAHKTRLQNALRVPGMDPLEKALLRQRLLNIPAAQGGYIEKQNQIIN
jgi:hypothetical protein